MNSDRINRELPIELIIPAIVVYTNKFESTFTFRQGAQVCQSEGNGGNLLYDWFCSR